MAERKRRGLGRGLGALINSDGESQDVAGAAAQAVPPVEPAIQAEPLDGTREIRRPERPIDVFFSAKSHLGTQRVSRETPETAPRSRARATTTARSRDGGSGRAQMPDVLGTSSRLDTADRDQQSAEPVEVSRETNGVEEGSFRSIPVERIVPNPRQPRQVFDEDEMEELKHSVQEIGVLQPIIVRPLPGQRYELIMGERRWRAATAVGHESIPAVVRDTSDENLLRDALLENIHRSELNPLEEAAAYQQLLEDFGISQEELSRRIGRSRPQISNTLRLMKLPPAVQRRVAAGVLSSGHARALLGLSSEMEMEELAQRITAEGLSVRGAEEAATFMKADSDTGNVSRETNRLPSSTRVQQLDEYADVLTDRLDTQVKISLGAKKGRIAIDFASIDDLNRIMELLGERQE